jgi:hypothetical protein
MGLLATGNCDIAIAGGVEFMSDVPIRYNRKVREAMLSLNKAKSIGQRLGLAGKFFMSNPLMPEVRQFYSFENVINKALVYFSYQRSRSFRVTKRWVIRLIDWPPLSAFLVASRYEFCIHHLQIECVGKAGKSVGTRV